MSRAVKWQVPFKSLAGNDCVVKIYVEDFVGDVTTLKGGAEPFLIEEDDSKNLLDLVRYTSGYLNVVEETFGDLDGLFPQTDFEHMVTLEVGGQVQFTGFMQAVEYDNNWDRGPRELHFPVMSPLGLMDHREFSNTYQSPVRNIAICELLAYVLQTINCGYTDVYVPATELNIDLTVSTLAVNGFNNNFTISAQTEDMFEHQSFDYLVKGICAAFGWMVHDVPGALVFMKWGWSGGYYRLPLSTLQYFTHTDAGISGDDELDFDDYFVVSGADNRQSYLRPLKEISLSIDGETAQNAQISFERMRYEGKSVTPDYGTGNQGDEDCCAAWLSPLSEDVGGTYLLDTNALNSHGNVRDTGVNVTDCGDINSHNKKILIRWDSTWDTNYTSPIFFVNIFNPPSGDVEVKFHIQWNTENKLAQLSNSALTYFPRMVACLYCDGSPLSPLSPAVTPKRWPLVFDKDGYFSIYLGLEFSQLKLPFCHKLTIEFYACNSTTDGYDGNIWRYSDMLLAFTQIAVNSMEGLFAEYTDNRTRIEKIQGNSDSPSAGTLNMPLSFYRTNSHMVGKVVKIPAQVSNFGYMFQSKHVVQVRVKVIAQPGLLVYGQIITLLGTQYRLVATKYEPREDDWTLLLIEQTSTPPPHPSEEE